MWNKSELVQSLRLPLVLGAVVGALFGVVTSQPLRASPQVVASPAQQSCAILCPSLTWLRAPVRYRSGG